MVFFKFLYAIPYILICYGVISFFDDSIVKLAVAGVASLLYFIIEDMYISKNNTIKGLLPKWK